MLELKIVDDTVTLRFEHSLVSLSKWESKYKKPFLTAESKESDDLKDYFRCMLLDGQDPDLIYYLSVDQITELTNYINESFTASSVPDTGKGGRPETVTSELIYYWMVALKINWEAQHWHLSRLMMLIKMTNYKQQPPKKQSRYDQIADWNKMNEQNQKLFGTDG